MGGKVDTKQMMKVAADRIDQLSAENATLQKTASEQAETLKELNTKLASYQRKDEAEAAVDKWIKKEWIIPEERQMKVAMIINSGQPVQYWEDAIKLAGDQMARSNDVYKLEKDASVKMNKTAEEEFEESINDPKYATHANKERA